MMAFEAENFIEAIEEFKREFNLGEDYDYKKEPYHIIAFYQAMSMRKLEITLQGLVREVGDLNTKLDEIKEQTDANATKISNAISGVRIHS